eukprot:gene2758-2798_t
MSIWVVPSSAITASDPSDKGMIGAHVVVALVRYTLRRADDALILGHRVSEWCGHAPTMEEDMALANMGLDLLGQARSLYSYAGEVEAAGRDEDVFAYRRFEREYENLLLVEQPNGDFACTILRQFLYAAFADPYWRAMMGSSDATLSAIAAKAEKELAYHLRHSSEWVLRLGDGTAESHRRIAEALVQLWPYTGEMFAVDAAEQAMIDARVAVDPEGLRGVFEATVREVLTAATLTVPEGGWMQSGGPDDPPGDLVMTPRERAWEAASLVCDPEIPVLTIADLGVLREVREGSDGIEVVITPTYSGCPAMNMIALEIETALDAAGVSPARVVTVLSPAWTTDWMTAEGRRKLSDYGIAPPAPASGRRALFSVDVVACPRCGRAGSRSTISNAIEADMTDTDTLVAPPRFHRLAVREIRRETKGAVSLRFDVPEMLAQAYRFEPGQYLTLRAVIDGEDIRRSYSICSAPDDGTLRVAVRQVDGGRFSTWINTALKPGDALEVMTPTGRFGLGGVASDGRLHVGIAAGSGITPILSIIHGVLSREPASSFSLFYGSRSVDDILFRDELEDLKDRHLGRLSVFHVLSREQQDIAILNGHIDDAKLRLMLRTVVPVADIDHAYLCGPVGMIETAEATLRDLGLAQERIHTERFVSSFDGVPRRALVVDVEAPPACVASIIVDGKRREVPVADGEAVLDAALRAGLDLPFACKGGMCSTCRAKVVEGTVAMELNYSLEPWELDQGFFAGRG